MDEETPQSPLPRKHRGYWMLAFIGVCSVILGVFMLINYVHSVRFIATSLKANEQEAPSLSMEQCAARTIQWASTCHAIADLCETTVTRMMKACVVVAHDSASSCAKYGQTIYGANFGAEACAPYMPGGRLHNSQDHTMKNACADTWQTIANYCQAVERSQNGKDD